MAPFYPYAPSALAPPLTHNYNCASSVPSFSLLTPTATLPVVYTPTTFSTTVSSHAIEDILHGISAADIAARPTSALDLVMKSEAPGAGSGGISTGATIGIIVAGIVYLIVLAVIVVKVCHY